MRHPIPVIGSEEQRGRPVPKLAKMDDRDTRKTTLHARTNQDSLEYLLDDDGNLKLHAD